MEINNFAIPSFLSKRGRLGCLSEQTTIEKYFLFEPGYHVKHLPTLANVQSE